MIVSGLSTWRIPESAKFRRVSPRPADKRQHNFIENFDDRVLFYDVFRTFVGERVVAVGPPFLNLGPAMSTLDCTAEGNDAAFYAREMDRVAEFFVHAPRGIDTLRLVLNDLAPFDISCGENLSRIFHGKRVLLTVSKNNELTWIADWVRFNVEVNNANAILLYDNGSTIYSLEELDRAISGIAGVEAVAIVDWPFKWGPSGFENGYWDSNFAQIGAWHHAKNRFLCSAMSVLNSDIDELCLPCNGQTVFDIVEASKTGYIQFPGRWIEGVPNSKDFNWERRRHRDFYSFLSAGGVKCMDKWAVVPYRCGIENHWGPHAITGARNGLPRDHELLNRHFKSISNGWKYNRSALAIFDATRHQIDTPLEKAFEKAFGGEVNADVEDRLGDSARAAGMGMT